MSSEGTPIKRRDTAPPDYSGHTEDMGLAQGTRRERGTERTGCTVAVDCVRNTAHMDCTAAETRPVVHRVGLPDLVHVMAEPPCLAFEQA
jgi:hypothetical protein